MANVIGLQMYTLRRELEAAKTPLEIYKKIKAAGYDAVQAKLSHAMKPAELKKVLDDAGLAPLSFSGNDFGQLLGILKEPKIAIEGAHALGVKQLDIGSIFIENRNSVYGYELFANLMNMAGKLVVNEGLKLSYHNHALELHNFDRGRTGMDVLVDECDPGLVDFCLDTHWLAAGGAGQVPWIKRLSGRMTMIHFKDYGNGIDGTSAPPRLFKAVGEGNIDWEPIAAACKEAGIGIYVVEQDECDRDPFDCIGSSARYMRKTLGL
ncbi:MAG: sugar phosphate isomerase/epimerase [Treponema sp.]|nr:sugar phosphate isomerase/epimerase [Treponema sp.]